MSYYGNYAVLLEKQRQEDNEKKKQQLINKIRAQQERFRRRYEKVYRRPRKNVTKEEANEYMTLMKEYYAERALREEKNRGEEFTLPISAHTFQKKKSQKKFGKSRKSNKNSPTHKLTATKLRKNRKKQKPIDAESKILTDKRDYRNTLKYRKNRHFGGRKRKTKRKRRRKTKKRRK